MPHFSENAQIKMPQEPFFRTFSSNIFLSNFTQNFPAKIGTNFLQKLQSFWKNPNCPNKFKLQVFDAVIRSKLVYGLQIV